MFERFAKVEPILKGFSGDKKYCVTNYDGIKYLLRVSPIEKLDIYKNLFEILKRLDTLGVPMCKPVEFGACSDSAYALYSWINGENLSDALPKLSEAEQYKLGVRAGEILRVIHTIPAPEDEEDWAVKFIRNTDIRIKKYQESDEAKFDGGEYFIKYIERNRGLFDIVENRPLCFRHGDYSVHNIMLENGELRIIDFDRLSYGDPWDEFVKTIFSAQISPHFTIGQVHGYFDAEPPPEFFKLMTLYIASPVLLVIPWAVPHGQEEVDFIKKLINDVLHWHDNMNNPVPSWYLKNYK